MSTNTARSFAPREEKEFRRKAYAAVLVGALSLFSWGCGNSGNSDFVSGGTVTASPSPIIIIPTPTPSPVTSPTPVQSVTVTTPLTISGRINVTNGSQIASFRQDFLAADGSVIPGISSTGQFPPANNQIQQTITGATIALVKGIRITFFAANGAVVGGAQAALTLTAGVNVTDAFPSNPTSSSTTATLTALTVQPPSATLSAAGANTTVTAQGTYTVSGFTSPVVANLTSGVTFASTNSSIATVSNTGVVTAVANGNALINATVGTVSSNAAGSSNITVAIGNTTASPSPTPVTSNVTISPATPQIAINGTQQLTVAVNGTNQTANATFTSSNSSIATVSASGLVTGVAVGTASVGAVVNINGSLFTASPNATVTVNNGTISTGLVLNPGTATTVIGGRVPVTATVNGTAVPITLTVANNATASVQGQTLVGVAAGTTNFTATSATGNLTATGTLTVATGATLTGMIIDGGTAGFTMAEGDQRQFRALAQFTVSGGTTAQSDVTQQAVWTVTTGAAGDTGTVVSFEPATAGNFTAVKGTGGTAQIGCIFMDGTRTVVTNQQTLTINKSTPTITINPVGVPTETNNSFIPASGWTRAFEARATYPSSGFSRTLGGGDSVSWSVLSGNALFVGAASQATIQGNPIVAAAGKAELQSLKVSNLALTAANFGTAVLNVTYGGAAAPTTAAASSNLNVSNYTLVGTTGALAPGLANDKNAIAGGKTYGRAVTVTGSFKAVPSNANFAYPLYTSSTSTNSPETAGIMSLYLLAGGSNSANGKAFFPQGSALQGYLATYNTISAQTAQFLTLAISPVGFSQFIQTTTTVGTQGALQIRVQHATVPGAQLANSGDTNLSGTSATTNQAGSDRDQARTATIAGVTLDTGTTFLFNSTVLGSAQSPGLPTTINRDSGLNVRLIAQYATGTLAGVQEDVTNLFGTQFGVRVSAATAIAYDFVDNGSLFKLSDTGAAIANSTGLFLANAAGAPAVTGLTRGQILVTSNQTAVANGIIAPVAKYPHTGIGALTTGTGDKSGQITVNVP